MLMFWIVWYLFYNCHRKKIWSDGILFTLNTNLQDSLINTRALRTTSLCSCSFLSTTLSFIHYFQVCFISKAPDSTFVFHFDVWDSSGPSQLGVRPSCRGCCCPGQSGYLRPRTTGRTTYPLGPGSSGTLRTYLSREFLISFFFSSGELSMFVILAGRMLNSFEHWMFTMFSLLCSHSLSTCHSLSDRCRVFQCWVMIFELLVIFFIIIFWTTVSSSLRGAV